MISAVESVFALGDADRMVVVAARSAYPRLADDLRRRYSDWKIVGTDNYLSAISEVCRQAPQVVVAGIDPEMGQFSNAVAGLREAAGPQAKLILCCPPEQEPIARRTVPSGADDYVLYPLEESELDAALGFTGGIPSPTRAEDRGEAVSAPELAGLATAVAAISRRPSELLDQLVSMVQGALHARGARIAVDGGVAAVGDGAFKPVLTARLSSGDKGIGSICLSERQEAAYTALDAARLEGYAELIAHVLQAASTQRQWRRLAMTDDCTGLPNRRFLQERMRAILAQSAQERFPVTLLLFDIDNFKSYNDSFGYAAGDEILRLTGDLFRKNCREQDVVTRYGGDEFAVVFWDPEGPRIPGSRQLESALEVLERFREALRSQRLTHLPPQSDASLTISGGLATYPWDGTSLPALLAGADATLRAAKRAGKNRVLSVGQSSQS